MLESVMDSPQKSGIENSQCKYDHWPANDFSYGLENVDVLHFLMMDMVVIVIVIGSGRVGSFWDDVRQLDMTIPVLRVVRRIRIRRFL